MSLPKIILTDIDGVWTDAGMYYDQTGNELKKYSTYDSAGVLYAHLYNIPVGIITGENTNIVKNRANKLKIDFLYLGVQDKVTTVRSLIDSLGIKMNEVAYVGDDINDIELLKCVGISAAPNNAPEFIKKNVDIRLNTNGGYGAFREFVETIFIRNNIKIMDLYESYLVSKNFTQ